MSSDNTNPPIPTGWQCPYCGTVYNPTVRSCSCKIKALVPEEIKEKGTAPNVPFTIRPTIPVPTRPWIPNDPWKPALGGGQMPTSPPPTPVAKWDPVRQVWLNGCANGSCNCTGRCNQPVGSPDLSSASTWGYSSSLPLCTCHVKKEDETCPLHGTATVNEDKRWSAEEMMKLESSLGLPLHKNDWRRYGKSGHKCVCASPSLRLRCACPIVTPKSSRHPL